MCVHTRFTWCETRKCFRDMADFQFPLYLMTRPLVASIDIAAMQHNLSVVRSTVPRAKIWAVVKANAYGHGLERSVRAFTDADGFALIEIEIGPSICAKSDGKNRSCFWKGSSIRMNCRFWRVTTSLLPSIATNRSTCWKKRVWRCLSMCI